MPLATTKPYRTPERVMEDVVVNEAVDSTSVQYAVIAGLRTETGPERFVIAYSNEQSLRELIAAPSILAAGFSSREEAVAGSKASMPTTVLRPRMPRGKARRKTQRRQPGLSWAALREDSGSALGRLTKFLATSYSNVATTALAIFFSRNAISAVIRMALGSTV